MVTAVARKVPGVAVPYTGGLPIPRVPMAKPNYSFEKRQRELAKQKKKDEKEAKKRAVREAARSDATPDDAPPVDDAQ